MVYTLEVETMIQIMQKHKKTGHLHADLPSGVPGLRESCHVEIALEIGNIISCSIAGSGGFTLTGNRAYQELTHSGRIRWTFVPPPSPITQPGLTTQTISCPRRIAVMRQEQMHSWPLMHKQVYGLADGTRSVADIAELLSATPKAIEEILRDLRSICVIAIE